jgi:hypothetical protein
LGSKGARNPESLGRAGERYTLDTPLVVVVVVVVVDAAAAVVVHSGPAPSSDALKVALRATERGVVGRKGVRRSG